MKKLYLAWQDPENRKWTPVGLLSSDKHTYSFVYTEGAKTLGSFEPFGRMNDLNSRYESKELFPIFSNRLLPKSRPEYKQYLDWLNLSEEEDNPFSILSLTSGIRATDSLELFECPLPNREDKFEVSFFTHGIRYLPPSTLERISSLNNGDRLFMMPDVQNPFDSCAVAIRTDDPVALAGYCPRYLTTDFKRLLDLNGPDKVQLSVKKVNMDSPLQFRLLCKIITDWPKGFQACQSEVFEPIVR